MKSLILATVLASMVASLAGCGQRGPLVLPESKQTRAAGTAAPLPPPPLTPAR